jgi:CheY-like chemotaxis protein
MISIPSERSCCAHCRVLVIDDNRDGRESLRLLLTLLGYRVEVAADGVEGVRKALQMRPEVAIVDLDLPKLDGVTVGRRLRRALGGRVVLVAYTALDDDELVHRVAEAGFDAHLVKPVELDALEPWLKAGTDKLTSVGGQRSRPGPPDPRA